MKLTVSAVLVMAAIFAFAGVQPIASYKDNLLATISNNIQNISNSNGSANADNITQANSATPAMPQATLTSVSSNVNGETSSDIHDIERAALHLINSERVKVGLPPTLWDNELYDLSAAHTRQMANQRQLFHSPVGALIAEDAWGGSGYSQYSVDALAQVIVDSWMSSPLHKAWLLHPPLKHSVVSIVSDSDGQYASWTFWTSEAGEGPPLIQKAYQLWQSETGGKTPWLTWLYDVKGYPNSQEFLRQLGVN